MKIQVIHGPNLNMLGVREPEIYGTLTMEQINEKMTEEAKKLEIALSFFQSNHEGAIVDCIQECYGKMDGIIINPGAYTHYSIAIRDAIAAVSLPAAEVHLSDIHSREAFRQISVIKDVCTGQFYGKGLQSYLDALECMAQCGGK